MIASHLVNYESQRFLKTVLDYADAWAENNRVSEACT